MRLAVVGAGYVGGVTAAGMAASGHNVCLHDRDRTRLSRFIGGQPDVREPGLEALIAQAGDRLRPAASLAEAIESAAIVFICVPTPAASDGAIDLTAVRSVLAEIRDAVHRNPLVVAIRSTVVPGASERLDAEFLAPLRAAGRDVVIAANPEFLREGRAVADFMRPDRIVIGTESGRAADLLREAYAFADAPCLVTSAASAELAKHANNALLATLISFSNELADLAERVDGADVIAAIRIVQADRRWRAQEGPWSPGILSYLWPGCGFGGSCLPKDLKALIRFAQDVGVDAPLLAAVDAVNEARADHVAGLVARVVPPSSRLAVLGTAFKEGTVDERESPGLALAKALEMRGFVVNTYDPLVVGGSALADILERTDAWVVVTGAAEFSELPERAVRMGRPLFDARRQYADGRDQPPPGPGTAVRS